MNTETDYILFETKKLKQMSNSELQEIIFNYDQEVLYLRKELEAKFVRYCELTEAQDRAEFLKNTNQLLSQELLSAHKEKTDLEYRLNRLENCKNQLQDLKKENEELVSLSKYPPADTEIVMLKLKVDTLKSDKEFLRTKAIKIQEEMDQISEKNKKVSEENEILKFQKDSVELEMKTVRETLLNKNLAIKEAFKELQAKVQDKKRKIKDLKSEIHSFRDRQIQNEENFRENLKEVEDAKRKLEGDLNERDEKIRLLEFQASSYEANEEKINEILSENEQLKDKYESLTIKNEKMVRKLVDLKHRQVNAKKEVMKLNHKLSICSEPNTPINNNFLIKNRLDSIQKGIMEIIENSNHDNQETYLITSGQIENIKRKTNELASLINEDTSDTSHSKIDFDFSFSPTFKKDLDSKNSSNAKIKRYSTIVVNKY